MRIQELRHHSLTESMGFSPVSLETTEQYPDGIWSSVLPNKWTSEVDWENVDRDRYPFDHEYEPPKNPDYQPDMNVNLSNSNMVYIMGEVLGFESEEHGYHIPIENFLTKAQIYLQSMVGQSTPQLDPHEEPREFKRQVTPDPETGLSSISGGHVGARMVHGGRREGYNEGTIMRMIKIAHTGQQMGATHVSAH